METVSTYSLNFTRFRYITLSDSGQDGFGHGAAVSDIGGCNFLWNKMRTQSIILMIKWGGRPSFLTVAESNWIKVNYVYLPLSILCYSQSNFYNDISTTVCLLDLLATKSERYSLIFSSQQCVSVYYLSLPLLVAYGYFSSNNIDINMTLTQFSVDKL